MSSTRLVTQRSSKARPKFAKAVLLGQGQQSLQRSFGHGSLSRAMSSCGGMSHCQAGIVPGSVLEGAYVYHTIHLSQQHGI